MHMKEIKITLVIGSVAKLQEPLAASRWQKGGHKHPKRIQKHSPKAVGTWSDNIKASSLGLKKTVVA